jgi:hypothetical protein
MRKRFQKCSGARQERREYDRNGRAWRQVVCRMDCVNCRFALLCCVRSGSVLF